MKVWQGNDLRARPGTRLGCALIMSLAGLGLVLADSGAALAQPGVTTNSAVDRTDTAVRHPAANQTAAVPATSARVAPVAAAQPTAAAPLPVTATSTAANSSAAGLGVINKSTVPSGTSSKSATVEENVEKHSIDDFSVAAPRQKAPADPAAFPWFGAAGSLILVLGLIVIVFWAMKRYLPGMHRLAGSPAVKVLARQYLSPRQSIAVVKIGRRIVLVGQSQESLTALANITAPEEVSQIVGECHSATAGSVTASFKKVFSNLDREYKESEEADAVAGAGGRRDVSTADDADGGRAAAEGGAAGGGELGLDRYEPSGGAAEPAAAEDEEMMRVQSELDSLKQKIQQINHQHKKS